MPTTSLAGTTVARGAQRLPTLGLPHQQQLGIGVGIQKLTARGQRDAGAVIAPMQSTAKVIMRRKGAQA
jgi:hypothetical protein